MPRLVLTFAITGCLLAGPLVGPAAAVSIEDLFHLKANGLGDDVLIALIETDGSVFQLTAEEVIALHRRGLGQRVIVAMIATGARSTVTPASVPIQQPVIQQPVVQYVEGPTATATVVVETPVVVPVYVPLLARPIARVRPQEPVYWGFGGQRRPDSWQPGREDVKTPEQPRAVVKTR